MATTTTFTERRQALDTITGIIADATRGRAQCNAVAQAKLDAINAIPSEYAAVLADINSDAASADVASNPDDAAFLAMKAELAHMTGDFTAEVTKLNAIINAGA